VRGEGRDGAASGRSGPRAWHCLVALAPWKCEFLHGKRPEGALGRGAEEGLRAWHGTVWQVLAAPWKTGDGRWELGDGVEVE